MSTKIGNYLHFPKGNGSYTVAENLSYYLPNSQVKAIGESSLGIYTDGNFPVLLSHPRSVGIKFANLSFAEYVGYKDRIYSALSNSRVDDVAIVHHGLTLGSILGGQIPIFSYLHGTEMLALKNGLPSYVGDDLRESIRLSKRVFVMSDKQKEMAESIFASELSKEPLVVPGGIDTSIFYRNNHAKEYLAEKYNVNGTSKKILFAGRLTPEKGLESLVDAFSNKNFSKNKELIIVGSGSELSSLKKLAYESDVKVHFVPTVSQHELATLFSAADVTVLPSHYESFGLVCLESLACGTPVVASNVGIMPQLVIPNNGGYIFNRVEDNEQTANNLRYAIDACINLPSEALLKRVNDVRLNYSWSEVALKISHELDS